MRRLHFPLDLGGHNDLACERNREITLLAIPLLTKYPLLHRLRHFRFLSQERSAVSVELSTSVAENGLRSKGLQDVVIGLHAWEGEYFLLHAFAWRGVLKSFSATNPGSAAAFPCDEEPDFSLPGGMNKQL